ncbi:hypothetical protein WDU94_006636 [Cyamophila willieti]
MGSLFSKLRRKRKLTTDDDSNSPKAKRVKLGSTGTATNIGYGMLFQQGRDSDIEVVLLGKTWKLHKSFLQQSPYFLKLLGDKSEVNKVRCSVSDRSVDGKSLELCFGFLYGGPLNFIQHSNVENVLATATFLEMNEIVDRVAEFLIRHANIDNAIKYFYLAEKYTLQEVGDHIYQRLLLNLIPLFKSLLISEAKDRLGRFLSEIKMDLLHRLVKDSDLVVVKDEYDVYLLMKYWLLCVTPCILGETSVDKYRFVTENGLSYLESSEGRPFTPLLLYWTCPIYSSYSCWKTHVTYYDASETSHDVDRSITPLQRVQIIRREKCFTCPYDEGTTSTHIPSPTPFRLFKRFTCPLIKPLVATVTLNGFVFSLTIGSDNTLMLKTRVKPDVPHILIPTLLYLRFTIFDMNSIWTDKGHSSNVDSAPGCAQLPPMGSSRPQFSMLPEGSNLPNNNQNTEASAGGSGTSPDLQWRSGVFTGSDLIFLLPYPPAGISRVLYDLPSGYYDEIRRARAEERAREQEKAQAEANAARSSKPTTSGTRTRHSSVPSSESEVNPSTGAPSSGSSQNEVNSSTGAQSSGSAQNQVNPSTAAQPSGSSQNQVNASTGAQPSGSAQNQVNPSTVAQSSGSSQNETNTTEVLSSGANGKLNDTLPCLHVFVTLKMVPYFELKAAKLLSQSLWEKKRDNKMKKAKYQGGAMNNVKTVRKPSTLRGNEKWDDKMKKENEKWDDQNEKGKYIKMKKENIKRRHNNVKTIRKPSTLRGNEKGDLLAHADEEYYKIMNLFSDSDTLDVMLTAMETYLDIPCPNKDSFTKPINDVETPSNDISI